MAGLLSDSVAVPLPGRGTRHDMRPHHGAQPIRFALPAFAPACAA